MLRSLILFTCSALIFENCKSIQNKESQFRSIELISKYPISIGQGVGQSKPYYLSDSSIIIDYEGYRVYRLPAIIQLETGNNIAGTEPYFVQKKGANFGVFYTSLSKAYEFKKLPVDSFLNARGIKQYDVKMDSTWTLVQSVSVNGVLTEKYAIPNPPREWSFDSAYLSYTQKLDIADFSLSKKMDSLKNLSFQEVRILFQEYYSQEMKTTIPRTEICVKIINCTVSNPEQIKVLLTKFQSDITK